jgi:hypothetical protein
VKLGAAQEFGSYWVVEDIYPKLPNAVDWNANAPLRPIGHVGLACFYHFDFIKHVADLSHTAQCSSLLNLPVIQGCWFIPLLSTETEVKNCQIRPGRISTASTPLLNVSKPRKEYVDIGQVYS